MNNIDKLTTREVEVIELVSQGLSNNEISDKLFITLHTTKAHITSIMQKLNSNNRVQIAVKWVKHKEHANTVISD